VSRGQRGGSPTVVNLSFLHRINRKTETLIHPSKEVGLEVNLEKPKYMLVSRDQNADKNQYIKIGNRSY
jgi:hypothetical protein